MDEWTREEKFALQEPEMKQLSRLYLVAGISTSLAVISAAMNPVRAQENYSAVGVFESHQDVGKVLHPGSVEYDAAKRSYTIAGSGENMWLGADAFQFSWKKMSGDVTLTADISFLARGANEHPYPVPLLPHTLPSDSPSADSA